MAAAAATGPPRDPTDRITIIGGDPDAYSAELAKKIDEINKIVVKPVRTREDIQDTLLPVYCFLLGYAKELLDPKNGFINISKQDVIEIFDTLHDSLLIQTIREDF